MLWKHRSHSLLLATTAILSLTVAGICLSVVGSSSADELEGTNAITSGDRQRQPADTDSAGMRRLMEISSSISSAFSSSTSYPVNLFQGVSSTDKHAGVEINRMRAVVATPPGHEAKVEHVILNTAEQKSFVEKHGTDCFAGKISGNYVLEKYNELTKNGMPHLAQELWKYCALSLSTSPDKSGSDDNMGPTLAYLDSETPLLSTFADAFLEPSKKRRNYAVLGSSKYFPKTMHGSFLFLSPSNASVAKAMLKVIIETDTNTLCTNTLTISMALYSLVKNELLGLTDDDEGADGDGLQPGVYAGKNGEEWVLLEQRCHNDPFSSEEMIYEGEYRLAQHCPSQIGHCCDITDPTLSSVVFLTQHPLLPYQLLPPQSSLPRPYAIDKNHDKDGSSYQKEVFDEDNLASIATIREEVFPRPEGHIATPNLYDIFHAKKCLPSNMDCMKCLRRKNGADCKSCQHVCGCYCQNLCKTKAEQKHVSKRVYVTPPSYSKDSSRLVPRIVHQTWYEAVEREKYPNMSRLIESWRQSGWEYRFYDDETAVKFISTHFPREVLQAYNAIKPGAFKADLFRYCTLLINGGVYADMDILLESNLDAAISGDVGFMSPVDAPGTVAKRRHCLWNGLMAVAPGHPFIAKVIEVTVNSIRNRFTSVDYDGLLCPQPELSVSHKFDTLFTTGPCILGYAVNTVLGNHPQKQFDAGDVEHDNASLSIPGRTIILNQNKIDMGAHRFTWLEKNLVIAATDLPDYDDRHKVESTEEDEEKHEHYSKTHGTKDIYGLKNLYTDSKKADENIEIIVK